MSEPSPKRLEALRGAYRPDWTDARARAARGGAIRRAQAQTRRRRIGAALTGATLVAALWWAGDRERGEAPVAPGAPPFSSIAARRVVLGPGVIAVLERPATSMRPIRPDGAAGSIAFELSQGAARFEVDREGGAFLLRMGPLVVEARAAAFAVDREGREGEGREAGGRVSVARGQVRVRWAAGHAVLAAGDVATLPPGGPPHVAASAPGPAGGTSTTTSTSTLLEAPAVLPIEVFGEAGAQARVVVPVDARGAARATGLALTIHGLSREGQANVRIGGGPWVPLTNETASIEQPERSLGGIGGAASTVRLVLPLAGRGLPPGPLEIAFRHEGASGMRIGFRVLALDLVGSDGAGLLPRGLFEQDDPARWQPPDPSPEAIEAGGRLWREAPLSEPGPGGARRPLRARCGDCHAADGRDLQYFAYSNGSIVHSALRLGLGEREGELIASYVRSLPYGSPGRPYHPPYQPGPGLDARPVEHWAAGAGLEAVLRDDLDALPRLFPRGVGRDEPGGRGPLNLRELPIALPLPDWNRWLPPVHPLDAWGDEFERSRTNATYRELRRAAAEARARPGALRSGLEALCVGWETDLGARKIRAPRPWSREHSRGLWGTDLWLRVKTWELMQDSGLEAQGAASFERAQEARTWPLQCVVLGKFGLSPRRQTLFSAAEMAYAQTAWRHLALLVNPGNGRHAGHTPHDYGALFVASTDLQRRTGRAEPLRYLAYMIKLLEEADNGVGPEQPARGWNLSLADVTRLAGGDEEPTWQALPPGLRRDLAEAFLREWLARARRFPPERYARAGTFGIEPADYVPSARGTRHADLVFDLLPRLREIGVSDRLVDEVSGWAAALWPRGDWPSSAR